MQCFILIRVPVLWGVLPCALYGLAMVLSKYIWLGYRCLFEGEVWSSVEGAHGFHARGHKVSLWHLRECGRIISGRYWGRKTLNTSVPAKLLSVRADFSTPSKPLKCWGMYRSCSKTSVARGSKLIWFQNHFPPPASATWPMMCMSV